MLVITSREVRFMPAMPRDAAVPSTVATTADTRATSSETTRARRMEELVSRLAYHLVVKPVNRA